MNEFPENTEAYLHEILCSLTASRARAEILAEKLEPADPQAAAAFRNFAQELWDVWTRHSPLMPTINDIYLAGVDSHKCLPRGCDKPSAFRVGRRRLHAAAS